MRTPTFRTRSRVDVIFMAISKWSILRRISAVAVTVAAALAIVGCASTASTPSAATDRSVPADPFVDWSETTRSYADELLEQARRLVDTGDTQAALDRIDDALCLALDPPAEIADDSRYLDFVAAVLADAEDLERDMADLADVEPEAEQVVVLPPIELPEESSEPTVTVGPDGLPTSSYPLVLNATVEDFLDAMTGDGEYRRRIGIGLDRAGRYLPMIRTKLAAAGLP